MRQLLRAHRNWGSTLGLLVFLAGVGLIAVAFWQAYVLYSTPPSLALGIEAGQPLDLSKAGDRVFALVWRALLLLVMTIVGSSIASRGIKMYQASLVDAPVIRDLGPNPPDETGSGS